MTKIQERLLAEAVLRHRLQTLARLSRIALPRLPEAFKTRRRRLRP